jgi:lipopolysaccharide/colanic/teichoic acid biosynthesis glycosyltransferase
MFAKNTKIGETVDNSLVFEKVFAKQGRTLNNSKKSGNIFNNKGITRLRKVDFDKIKAEDRYSLYMERYFNNLLVVERKRSERSRNHFLLMLVDISKVSTNRQPSFLRKISNVLEISTRDIDIKGWYKNRKILGIIFTESQKGCWKILVTKIKSNISDILGPEIAKLIEISWIDFPQEHDNQIHREGKSDVDLYKSHDLETISNKAGVFAKRSVDFIGSLFFILLFSPFFIVIPILIKLTSKGPVFFRQERSGKGGKNFSFLKFRSMYVNNDATIHKDFVTDFIKGKIKESADGQKPCFKIKNDPRVTPLGRILRKTSLDEIPQFINVLMGDMSLVGPRPSIPYEIEQYDLWHRRRVLEVKPGITGLWQVEGRSSLTFDNMVRLDLQYIKKWSFFLDMKLLIKTPFTLVKGAY